MSYKCLHVISFDVPFPANYGGVIDVFYKVKALHEIGIKIILHCFEYGRSVQMELDKYTIAVYYYKRDTSVLRHVSKSPYIVNSRRGKGLLNTLLLDNYPILFEGLHTCGLLDSPELKNRKKIVRTHNIEHDYYNALGAKEKNVFKKAFFKIEARKLLKYETVLNHADSIACISTRDLSYLKKYTSNVFLLPPFHSNEKVDVEQSVGDYILYQGSLDVAENIDAVLFLINVFRDFKELPFIIAGRNPSRAIINAVRDYDHISLRDNLSSNDMRVLIREAQINVLVTFQSTGVKLKLLEALYNGKHVLCNSMMLEGTGLESICHVASSPSEFIQSANKLKTTCFSSEELSERIALLDKGSDNITNASILEKFLFL